MKKKLFSLLFILALMFGGVKNAKAVIECDNWEKTDDGFYVCADGATASGLYGHPLSNKGACKYGRYNPGDINAVRLSVVDTNGNRVSARSVDFYSGGGIGIWSNTYVALEQKTRNDIVRSGVAWGTSSSIPNIEPLANLPYFKDASDAADRLGRYFKNQFASGSDMTYVFNLLGYQGYKDSHLYENHLLLIEPIYKFFTDYPSNGQDGCSTYTGLLREDYDYVRTFANSTGKTKDQAIRCLTDRNCANEYDKHTIQELTFYICDCEFTHTYYYGTVTDIFYIMSKNGDKFYTYKTGSGGSVETVAKALGGLVYDNRNVGDLWNATDVIANYERNHASVYNNIISQYGLGSMHIWMKEIVEGDGSCTYRNQYGIEITMDMPPDILNSDEATKAIWKKINCPEFCPLNSAHPDVQIPIEIVDNEEEKYRYIAQHCDVFEGGTCPANSDNPYLPMPEDIYNNPNQEVRDNWIQDNCYNRCDYKIDSNLGGNCTEPSYNKDTAQYEAASNGYVKDHLGDAGDLKAWKCIADTYGSDANTYKGEYYNPGGTNMFANNKYCNVICAENIKYNFFGTFRIEAGRGFSIGQSNASVGATLNSPTITGQTICTMGYLNDIDRTMKIDYGMFKQDYDALNASVEATWDQYQRAVAAGYAMDSNTGTITNNGTATEYTEDCKESDPMRIDYNDCIGTSTPAGWYASNGDYQTNPDATCGVCDPAGWHPELGQGGACCHWDNGGCSEYQKYVDPDHCTKWEHAGSDGNRKHYYIQPKKATYDNGAYSATVYYDETVGDASGSTTAHLQNCDGLTPLYDINNGNTYVLGADGTYAKDGNGNFIMCRTASSVKTGIENTKKVFLDAYNKAVADRDGAYSNIMQCNNFQRTYNEFNPSLTFSYAETSSTIPLDESCQTTSYTNYIKNDYEDGHQEYIPEKWDTPNLSQNSSTFIWDLTARGYTDLAEKKICGNELTRCTSLMVSYPINTSVTQVTTTTCEYTSPYNLNRYITKDGLVVDNPSQITAKYEKSYTVAPEGVGRIFVSPKTQSGDYLFMLSFGQDNLFGERDKFTRYKTEIDEFKNLEDVTYTCPYHVECSVYNVTCAENEVFDPSYDTCCRPETIIRRDCPEVFAGGFNCPNGYERDDTQKTKDPICCKKMDCYDRLDKGQINCGNGEFDPSNEETCCKPKNDCDQKREQGLINCGTNEVYDKTDPKGDGSCCRPLATGDCLTRYANGFRCQDGEIFDENDPTCCRPDSDCLTKRANGFNCGYGEIFDENEPSCCKSTSCVRRTCPDGSPMTMDCKCPPNIREMTIIYRPISLNDPFPGEDGEGRFNGSNWNGVTTVLGSERSFVDAFITNNRGVETEEVYNQTPMYEFSLTAANLRAIRKYNKDQRNNYVDIETLTCNNGSECKSSFLQEGIANGYFKFTEKNSTGGSCFNAYTTDWESCRYTNIGG